MSCFEELKEGLYYICCSFNPNYCLSIQQNKIEPNIPLIISNFYDSFYQAFYFYKNKDFSYSIMNINSLKIIGIDNIYKSSTVIQNIISPLENYKWEIRKTNNFYKNEYYIELKSNSNQRIDCLNNFVIINNKNDNSNTQRFVFRECLYNVPKSDLWIKWEKYHLRDYIENQMYIIRSAENDNFVFNFNSYNNNISLNNFNGNKEQLFFIIKLQNNLAMIPFNLMKQIENKSINGINFLTLKNTLSLFNLNINNESNDYNGIHMYKITNGNGLNLEISPTSNFFNFNSISSFLFPLLCQDLI